MCSGFKASVNPVLKNDVYHLTLPEELSYKLNGGRKFTELDLADAYLQIKLDNSSKQLVVLNTHQQLCYYKRMPFGLSCALAILQRIIEQAIGVACYLDDIIITGKTEADHLTSLQRTLERLKERGFRLRKSKCSFIQPSVVNLGHIINKEESDH